MKLPRFFPFAGAVMLFTLAVHAQSFLTNGLVAYYPFNGNANDASGNGYNGTPTSVTYGYDRFGQPFRAALFDGLSSKIPIYGIPNANFFPITLSVWVKGVPITGGDTGIIGNYGIASANGYALTAFGDHVRSAYFGSQGSVYGGDTVEGIYGYNTLNGVWHQIVVTYDSTGGLIYVDGALVDSLGWGGSGAASTTTAPIIIGDSSSTDGTDNRYFTGSLDDIRIYNRALSANEIAQLFAYESAPPQNLLLNGNFDFGNTGFASDYTFARIDSGETTYDIVQNPSQSHFLAASFGDHTSGHGLMLVANGSTVSNTVVWREVVGVATNTAYQFSGWTTPCIANDNAPALINLSINGSPVTPAFQLSNPAGQWQRFSVVWDSGSSTLATIDLRDEVTVQAGNDFALDDFGFSIATPHGATGTATLFGGSVNGVIINDVGFGYTNTPLVRFFGGGGSGAQAFAVVNNGVVMSITVTNAGYGYTSAPLVVIDPPFIPNPVLGIAPMSFLSFFNLAVGGIYQLQQFQSYYWANQPTSFTATNATYSQMLAGLGATYRLALSPVPSQAFATPQVIKGFVVDATVTAGGSGYVTTPAVNIYGDVGSNATAVASISGGVVTNVTMINAGMGYTNIVEIQIDPPPAAAVSPTSQPVMRLDSSSLAPYDNYQIQFTPALGGAWENWIGGLFSPIAVTNSQYLFITNGTGYFRLQYVP